MKKNSGVIITLLTFLICAGLISRPVLAQDAGLLNMGVQQFFNNNGDPLSSGKVYFYEVGTSTFKDTYTSSAATTINPNPITLNAGGKSPNGGIYGIGTYRQVVRDKNNNLIWDAVTSPTGGGGSTPTDVGDGNLVGTVLPWASLVAPNQYLFAYGQEINRSAYPEFYTAITLQSNVICSSASNILTGLVDTSQIPIGAAVELSLCVNPGTTVVSKTASTVTLSNPSSVSINSVATFFPFGNGNGSTTFNVPDLRDLTIIGRPNMGGTDRGLISEAFYTTNPAAQGAVKSSQSVVLTTSNLPPYTPAGTIVSTAGTISSLAQQGGLNAGGILFASNTAGFSFGIAGPTITSTFTGTAQGGTSVPVATIQPSMTMNYIIKVTPDTSTSIATGVYSIGGMTGIISCGTGILCTGNIISFNGNVLAGGSTGSVQYRNSDGSFGGSPNFIFTSPNNLSFGAIGTTAQFDILGAASGRVRQTVPAVAGTTNIAWGNSSGTPAVTASLPIVLNTTTGNLTCPTCATSSLNGQALTRTNDTNVTLTLGGASATALLSPASITVGWVGELGLSRGGTNANLTASNGGIVWSNATQLQILAGTANANRPLVSGSTATPAWGAFSLPTSVVSGGVAYFNSTSSMSSSNLLATNGFMLGGGAGGAPTSTQITGLVVGNGSSAPTAFSGITCTNQFITAIGVSGLGTCNSVTNSYLTAGTFSNITGVGTLGAGGASTGFTISAANVTWSGQIPGANVATAANASGSPSATFGVVKCDGTTITCASGVITAVGAAASDIAVGTTTVSSGTNGYLLYNNSGVLGNQTFTSAMGSRSTLPTIQVLTSGSSATYTTPSNVLSIKIRMCGGGGGGAGGGTGGGASGAGNNTTFGTLTANGGGSSAGAGSNGGAGGAASGGDVNISGSGGGVGNIGVAGTVFGFGGAGGVSAFGGAGRQAVGSAGGAAAANSCSGGAGGGTDQAAVYGGGGGGAGGYVEKIINSPSATYTYTVGTGGSGGSAGTSGYIGGTGGAGIIIVEEYYNS